MIRAYDRRGARSTLCLDAIPRDNELDGQLPVARVHR